MYAGQARLGSFQRSQTTIPRPGFITFTGAVVPTVDDDLLHGMVRGISLLFGVAPCVVAWVARGGDGRLCSWVLRAGYSPAPTAVAWPVAKFVDRARPWVIGGEPLSIALRKYLEQRKSLALDRVAWIASHGRSGPIDRLGAALRAALETLVEAAAPETPRTIVDKARARPLLDQLAWVVTSWAASNDVSERDVQRLASKARQVNDTSSLARLPTLLAAHDLSFGTIERDAWDFSNKCTHAAPAAMGGGEETLFRFRALQATFGRIVVGVAGLHDHNIDYSTAGFPARPVAQAVGGDDGSESNIARFRQEGAHD